MGVYESLPVDPKLFAFRIYQLNKEGPLYQCGVKELSDFLIPPNEVYENKTPFATWISSNAGKDITLSVYSLSTRAINDITIKVNATSGKGGYLGGAVRYENWVNAHKSALHLTNVKRDSFGEKTLGLIAQEDYIIAIKPQGQDIITLNIQDVDPLTLFSAAIKENKGKECEMYIYNETKGPRCVKFTLNNDPYFELGIEAAYGKLHEFPIKKKEEEVNLIPTEEQKKEEAEEIIEKIDTDVEPNKREEKEFKEEMQIDSHVDETQNKDKQSTETQIQEEMSAETDTAKEIKEDGDSKALEEKIKSPNNVFL